ncbi:MAG: DUF2512 family protein [Bacillota bacterium]
MNKTFTALVIKFLMTSIASYVAFRVTDNNGLTWILSVALAATVLNYLLGDLLILGTLGNLAATVADGVLAAFTAYLGAAVSPGNDVTSTSLLVFAVLVALGEYLFHTYLSHSRKVAP